MRLIDADALMESAGLFEVKMCARGCGKSILHLAKAWLSGEVSKAPTIDAEPVVRCKDCIQYRIRGCANGFGWCEEYDMGMMDNCFCSYGERREDDGNV